MEAYYCTILIVQKTLLSQMIEYHNMDDHRINLRSVMLKLIQMFFISHIAENEMFHCLKSLVSRAWQSFSIGVGLFFHMIVHAHMLLPVAKKII